MLVGCLVVMRNNHYWPDTYTMIQKCDIKSAIIVCELSADMCEVLILKVDGTFEFVQFLKNHLEVMS